MANKITGFLFKSYSKYSIMWITY